MVIGSVRKCEDESSINLRRFKKMVFQVLKVSKFLKRSSFSHPHGILVHRVITVIFSVLTYSGPYFLIDQVASKLPARS